MGRAGGAGRIGVRMDECPIGIIIYREYIRKKQNRLKC
jgi:hypothetical protein